MQGSMNVKKEKNIYQICIMVVSEVSIIVVNFVAVFYVFTNTK